MQLKTDKCNFIHLGRCVKSGAPNIPHDSPWLIFPWSETPIISHEPNSTRMARRSPRGQFSGHLPLTHCSLEGERRRGGDGAAKRGQRHEGEGGQGWGVRRGEEERSGHEEERWRRWDGWELETSGRTDVGGWGGGGGGGDGKAMDRYQRKETRKTKRIFTSARAFTKGVSRWNSWILEVTCSSQAS